jgi:very-short-patch-repair endonuclease
MLRFTDEAELQAWRERRWKKPAASKPRARKEKPVRESWNRILARQIERARLPVPILEYSFDAQLDGDGRAWRFDLCWPELKIGIEVDGGAHAIRSQLDKDIDKYRGAFERGYRVLRVSPEQVQNGEALRIVRKALG